MGVDDSRNDIIVHMPGKTNQIFNTRDTLFFRLLWKQSRQDVNKEDSGGCVMHSSFYLVCKHRTSNTITNSKDGRNGRLKLLVHLEMIITRLDRVFGGFASFFSVLVSVS